MSLVHVRSSSRLRGWQLLVMSLILLVVAVSMLPASPVGAQSPPIYINFQPASVQVPPGNLPDSGKVYGNRGNGYTYGWNVDHSNRARAYQPPFSWLDRRYWTLIDMQTASGTKWEIAVPNGTYQVKIVAGGPVNAGHRQKINAEGVVVVDDLPTDYNSWVGGTTTVTISDGRLTVSNGSGATGNRICFIEIVPQP